MVRLRTGSNIRWTYSAKATRTPTARVSLSTIMPPKMITRLVATAVSISTDGFRAEERRLARRLESRYFWLVSSKALRFSP